MQLKSAAFCVAVIALMAIGSTLEAQDRDQRQGRSNRGASQQRMSRSALLRVNVVHDELEISEEQMVALNEMLGQRRGGGERGERGGERGERGGERGERGGERGERGGERGERGGERGERGGGRSERGGERSSADRIQAELDLLGEVLEADQIERLNQIFVQVAGVSALQDPLVAKELAISEEQYKEMKEIRDQMRSEFREMARDGDREEMRQRYAEMNEEVGEKMMAVLTSSQRNDLDDMKGEKFELPEDALRQRRGRSRGQEGPDGNG